MDTLSSEQRQRCMSAIRGKDTRPEMIVRRYLHSLGYRYGLHNRKLPGRPDLVLRKLKTVIFVNGCFWHGHEGCRYYRLPKSNVEFWTNKITRNQERDREVRQQLEEKGWNVITIWECELRNSEKREATLAELYRKLRNLKIWPRPYSTEDDIAVAAEPEDL